MACPLSRIPRTDARRSRGWTKSESIIARQICDCGEEGSQAQSAFLRVEGPRPGRFRSSAYEACLAFDRRAWRIWPHRHFNGQQKRQPANGGEFQLTEDGSRAGGVIVAPSSPAERSDDTFAIDDARSPTEACRCEPSSSSELDQRICSFPRTSKKPVPTAIPSGQVLLRNASRKKRSKEVRRRPGA